MIRGADLREDHGIAALPGIRRSTITLKKVAEHAGVSITAVSCVLRGRGDELRISEACSKRILASAKTLGYRGNYHAQSLLAGFSRTIGLATNQGAFSILYNPYWHLLTAGVEEATRACGYNLRFVGSSQTEGSADHALNYLHTRQVDSVIFMRQLVGAVPDALAQRGLPIVMLQSFDLPGISHVNLDPQPGLVTAAHYLSELGHRDIVWLSVNQQSSIISERIQGFATVAASLGLRLQVRSIPFQEQGWISDQESRLDHLRIAIEGFVVPPQVTTLLCDNDEMAFVLMQVLQERGIRVPHEVSVIGFDDIYSAMTTSPALTTVSHRLADMGSSAVRLATDLIEGRTKPGSGSSMLPSTLTIRKSCAVANIQRVRTRTDQ